MGTETVGTVGTMAADQDAATTRVPLSRERVLLTALALADTIGLDALSMRRLGLELGVEAMSLYYHLPNKDAILDGIVDLVVSEIDLPRSDAPWKTAMRARALSAHAVLLRHPWACHQLLARLNTGPAMLRYVDATWGCMRAAGFSVAHTDEAVSALDSHLYGYTLQRLLFPIDPSAYADTASDYLQTLDPTMYPHISEMGQAVIDGVYDGNNQFTFGLDLILDGLERLLRALSA